VNLPDTLSALPVMNQPLQAPGSCPMTHNLVYSLLRKTQAPADLILLSALSTYSLLLQGRVDVERPGVGVGPVSLFGLTIADSGERKSTVARLLERPVVEFQSRQNEEYAEKVASYEAETEIFQDAVKVLRKRISGRLKKELDVDDLKCQLVELRKQKPKKPRKIQMIFEDVTTEAIAVELNQGCGSAALVSDEGATILNGRIVQDLPRLNKLWSAERFNVTRKSSESFTVDDARLTVSIMAQPSAVAKFMKKRGDESLGIGFLARFLVCNPDSSQGTRLLRGSLEGDCDGYQDYLQRANEILCKKEGHVEKSKTGRNILRFTDEAKIYWEWLYNEIEKNLQINGRFQYARDHGSKLAENITRIAALLSCIEYGEDQKISIDVLKDAEVMGFYFSDVFLRCFESTPEYVKDLGALRDYLQGVRDDGRRFVRKNKIRQSGPSRMRNKPVLDFNLDELARLGEVSILVAHSGMVVVDLYPSYLHDDLQWSHFCLENRVPATDYKSLL